MSATFRELVRDAFTNTLRKSEKPDEYPEILAEELRGLFRLNGYEVHALGSCVRPKFKRGESNEFGREMTRDETIALGLEVVGDGLAEGDAR